MSGTCGIWDCVRWALTSVVVGLVLGAGASFVLGGKEKAAPKQLPAKKEK